MSEISPTKFWMAIAFLIISFAHLVMFSVRHPARLTTTDEPANPSSNADLNATVIPGTLVHDAAAARLTAELRAPDGRILSIAVDKVTAESLQQTRRLVVNGVTLPSPPSADLPSGD